MFMFGLMAAITPSIVPKVTAVWFSGKRPGPGQRSAKRGLVYRGRDCHFIQRHPFLPIVRRLAACIVFLRSASGIAGAAVVVYRPRAAEARRCIYPVIRRSTVPEGAIQRLPRQGSLVVGDYFMTYLGANLGVGGYLPLIPAPRRMGTGKCGLGDDDF